MTPAQLVAERAILPRLANAAQTSIDRAIIQSGIIMRMVPSILDVKPEHPADIDIVWLRFRAACARAEATLHPNLATFLRNRAHQADNEANARERAREIPQGRAA